MMLSHPVDVEGDAAARVWLVHFQWPSRRLMRVVSGTESLNWQAGFLDFAWEGPGRAEAAVLLRGNVRS